MSANVEKLIILDKENEFDKSLLIKNQSSRIRLTKGIKAIIALFVLTLLLLFIAFYKRKHKYDQLIRELKQEYHNQAEDEIKLQEHFKQVNTDDKDLNAFISSHINMMRKVIEASYHAPNNVLADEIKSIVKFQAKNKNNWDKLHVFIDKEFNGIMKHTKDCYPQLNEKELLLLALTCLDYSCAQIAIIMGYANASTIGGNRQRLARKMKLTGSLNDYILQFKKSNCS